MTLVKVKGLVETVLLVSRRKHGINIVLENQARFCHTFTGEANQQDKEMIEVLSSSICFGD
jgi:hypothetical protein